VGRAVAVYASTCPRWAEAETPSDGGGRSHEPHAEQHPGGQAVVDGHLKGLGGGVVGEARDVAGADAGGLAGVTSRDRRVRMRRIRDV
jgi:hypothetical protein